MQEKLKISLRNSLTFSTSLNPADRRVTGSTSPSIPHSSQPRCNFQPLAYCFSTGKTRETLRSFIPPRIKTATLLMRCIMNRRKGSSFPVTLQGELTTPLPSSPRISTAALVSNSGHRSLCVRTRYVSDSLCACVFIKLYNHLDMRFIYVVYGFIYILYAQSTHNTQLQLLLKLIRRKWNPKLRPPRPSWA